MNQKWREDNFKQGTTHQKIKYDYFEWSNHSTDYLEDLDTIQHLKSVYCEYKLSSEKN
jgi:hypothetical protein